MIRIEMENSLAKEIPESSQAARQVNIIPLKIEVDKAQIRKEYKKYLGKY